MKDLRKLNKREICDLVMRSERLQSLFAFEINAKIADGKTLLADQISRVMVDAITDELGQDYLQEIFRVGLCVDAPVHLKPDHGGMLSAYVDSSECAVFDSSAGQRLNNMMMRVMPRLLDRYPKTREADEIAWRSLLVEYGMSLKPMPVIESEPGCYTSPSGTGFYAVEVLSHPGDELMAFAQAGVDDAEHLVHSAIIGIPNLDHHGRRKVLFVTTGSPDEIRALCVVDASKHGLDFNAKGGLDRAADAIRDAIAFRLFTTTAEAVEPVADASVMQHAIEKEVARFTTGSARSGRS